MKRFIFLFVSIAFLASCNSGPTVAIKVDDSSNAVPATSPVEDKPAQKLSYSIPIPYSDWEMGNPQTVETILCFYKEWDENNPAIGLEKFADTLIMRLPGEIRQIKIPNNRIHQVLSYERNGFRYTNNRVISAIPLHDKQSGEDWVMITAYSRWKAKGERRDSMLFQDNWHLKNDKIYFLMSFEKKPTAEFLQNYGSYQ